MLSNSQAIENIANICYKPSFGRLTQLANRFGMLAITQGLNIIAEANEAELSINAKKWLNILVNFTDIHMMEEMLIKLGSFDSLLHEVDANPDIIKRISTLSDQEAKLIFEIKLLECLDGVYKYISQSFSNPVESIEQLKKQIAYGDLYLFVKFKLMKTFLAEFGSLEITDGLITCAQIASRKLNYTFNPTLIFGLNDLQIYLDTIMEKKNSRPNLEMRERFVLIGTHWISGDLLYDGNGNVKILLIDSVSFNKKNVVSYETPDILSTFANTFPNQSIYFACEKRQRDYISCWLYALDDVLHLFTLEERIGQNLFEYFDQQNAERIVVNGKTSKSKLTCAEIKKIEVTPVKIPLSLLRSTQSTLLITMIEQRSLKEQNTPINKKGQIAIQSTVGLFQTDATCNANKNLRLHHIFKKNAERNFQFVFNHSLHEIYEAMSRFTVSAFKERMNLNNILNPSSKPYPHPLS